MGYRNLRKRLFEILKEDVSEKYTYHNVEHARDVLHAMNSLIKFRNISGILAENLRLAAISHDIGFVNSVVGHEKEGATIMRKLMVDHNYLSEDIDFVCDLILITDRQKAPSNEYEKMMLDADLYYLGSKEFEEKLRALYYEWVSTNVIPPDYTAFLQSTLDFMNSHTYYTDYAVKNQAPKKQKWMKKIRDTLAKT